MLRTRKEIASARNFAKAAPLAEHSAMPRGEEGRSRYLPHWTRWRTTRGDKCGQDPGGARSRSPSHRLHREG